LLWALVAAGIVTGVAGAPARAQVSGDPSAEAADLNRRSKKLYQDGRYAEAAVLLREAYRLKPEPVIQYNLARSCEKLADYACAVAAYESYLASHPADRADVELQLASCRAQLAAAATPVPPAPVSVRAEPPRPSRSVVPPIVGAVGLVGVGVGLVMESVARSWSDEATNAMSQQAAVEKRAAAESLANTGTVTLVAAGAVTAAGVIWWIIDTRSSRAATPKSSTTSLQIGARSVAIRVAF
jgi:tetratricopeptide (TPR) repeat protein